MTWGFKPRPGPLKWNVNRRGYVTRFTERIPNDFVPLVNNETKRKEWS